MPTTRLAQMLLDAPVYTSEGRRVYPDPSAPGQVMTEKSVTVPDPRQRGGWLNIPTVYNGQIMDQDTAFGLAQAAGYSDPVTGRQLPTFRSLDEAIADALTRSARLGRDIER